MCDEEILATANDFARGVYALHGYRVEEGYRFDKARHPQERMMWEIAVLAFASLRQTDLTEVLTAVEEGEQ